MRYHQFVRTTVNLEPWVLAGLKSLAQREGTTLGKIIERLYQKSKEQPKIEFERSESGFPLLPVRRKGKITDEDIKKIQEEIDREDYEKHTGRKWEEGRS